MPPGPTGRWLSGRSLSTAGWRAPAAARGGGKVEGLPVHTFPTDDGDGATKGPTEIAINDRREFELSTLGFMPGGFRVPPKFPVRASMRALARWSGEALQSRRGDGLGEWGAGRWNRTEKGASTS